MKTILAIMLLFTVNCFSQNDELKTVYSNTIEIKGTPFIVTNKTSLNKGFLGQRTLAFIDTSSGYVREVELANGVIIQDIKNFQTPELGINKVFVTTLSKTAEKSYAYNRFFIVSPDGLEKSEIQIDKELISQYVYNSKTGRLTFFLNRNSSKIPNSEQIVIVDLKTSLIIN
jgi:hypothetical protein